MFKLHRRMLSTFLVSAMVVLSSVAFAAETPGKAPVPSAAAQTDSTSEISHSMDSLPDTVEVRFDLNGGPGDAVPSCTLESDTNLTLPQITGLTEASPDFLGWSMDPDSIETLYQPGDAISIAEDTVLYAMWKHVTVTYLFGDTTVTETILQRTCPVNIPAVTDTEQATFTGWMDQNGQIVRPAACPVAEDVTYTARFAAKINTQDHVVYINGYPDGTFHPNEKMTRAEAAKMVYGLLLPFDSGNSVTFTDVSAEMWYGTAVNALASMGVINGYGDGTFLPQNQMTRAEFVAMLARLFYVAPEETQTFTDVSKDHWAYRYIEYAAAQGWIKGYGDGTFLPSGQITRAEAVTVLNRIAGRVGDQTVIFSGTLRTFHDVPSTFWGYAAIMEACTEHTYTGTETWTTYEERRAEGLYQHGHELRYADANGWDVRNATVGNFTFDENGNYTSGNSEIDRYCKEVLAKVTTEEMTQEEQLKALYLYTRDSFHYLKRDDYGDQPIDWERETLLMFQTGYGNCYNYGSVFYCMARQIGYDARLVSGTIGKKNLPHCWVEITIDGTDYLFDPEQEMLQRKNGIYYYDLFMIQKDKTPWTYTPYASAETP